jgi:hypothetical protein
VLRNYSIEYITSIVPETIATLGPEEGGHLAGAAARLIGMHTFDEFASLLGASGRVLRVLRRHSRASRPAKATMRSLMGRETSRRSNKRHGA